MMNIHKKNSIKGIAFSLMLAFASIISFDAWAANDCAVQYKGGHVSPECPDGRMARYDISPKCIENANKGSDKCINTMPVTNVARIPEDVCFRGQGWGRKRNHNGMDYAAAMGTAVTAAMDGKIIRFTFGTPEPARGQCQSSGGGYGNVIYIQHKGCDGSYTTRYGHLTNKIVPGLANGVQVKKGQLIGYVGGTGGACGRPHLHFELRGPGDVLMNPSCDKIQGVCNCKTPITPVGLSKCKDASFEASSSTPIAKDVGSAGQAAGGTSAVTIAQSPNAEEAKKGTDECAPYEEVRNSYRQWGCIFCKPFEILFNVSSAMAKQSYDVLAKAVIPVVLIGMALWLAFTILKYVAAMDTKEPRYLVKTLLNQFFRVAFVIILLNMPLPYIMANTIDPIFNTGMQVAQLAGRIDTVCDLGGRVQISENGGLSPSMGNGILCTIKSMQDQIGDILSLGELSWCLSWADENRVLFVFPHLAYLITSILFYIGGLLILIIYPFLLVDCILKLAIAMAILPAALGAYAFKTTEKYLKSVWNIFLNAMFSFIFLSIVVYIITSIAADTVHETMTEEMGIVMRLFWWTLETTKVLAVCLLGWAVLGEMKNFANKFASGINLGSGNVGIGEGTGTLVGEMALKRPFIAGKNAAKTATKTVGGFAMDGASEGVHRASLNLWNHALTSKNPVIRTFVGNRANTAQQEVRDEDGNVSYETMKDEKGNVVYDTTSIWQRLRGKRELRSVDTDANGNVRMNITRTKSDGSSTVTTTDAYATSEVKYDKNHEVVSEKETAETLLLKRATRPDGSIDKSIINDFMQNSLLDTQTKQILVMKSIIKERMSKTYSGQMLSEYHKGRTFVQATDPQGRKVWQVKQKNLDNTISTFTVTFGQNNRVMTEIKTMDFNGKGISYTSDGIVEKRSTIVERKDADGKVKVTTDDRYSFTKYYSQISSRPLYSNGDFANNVPHKDIMFSKEDLDKFAKQVAVKGNKAYAFTEFR